MKLRQAHVGRCGRISEYYMKRKSNRKIIVAGKDDSPAMLMNAVWALVHLKKSVVLCEILQVKIVEQ